MNITYEQAATFFNLLRKSVEEMKQELADAVAGEARQLAPVDTGSLQGSISGSFMNADTFGLDSTAPYAGFVIFGTGLYGPHKQEFVIRAKNAYALHWGGDNSPWFFKSTRHKGQEPNNFPLQAAIQVIDSGRPLKSLETAMQRNGLL